MIQIKTYTFPTHVKGTSFKEKPFRVTSGLSGETLEPMDLTGAQIKMEFKKDYNSRTVFTFDSADGTILIVDPLNGEFSMAERVLDACEGSYLTDVMAKFSDGSVKLLFRAIFPFTRSTTEFL